MIKIWNTWFQTFLLVLVSSLSNLSLVRASSTEEIITGCPGKIVSFFTRKFCHLALACTGLLLAVHTVATNRSCWHLSQGGVTLLLLLQAGDDGLKWNAKTFLEHPYELIYVYTLLQLKWIGDKHDFSWTPCMHSFMNIHTGGPLKSAFFANLLQTIPCM